MSEYIRISLIWAMRINRIRLEFKVLWNACTADSFRCINRIRLEFKGPRFPGVFRRGTSINRIRLEFKVVNPFRKDREIYPVLIESDWNLKKKSLQMLWLQVMY